MLANRVVRSLKLAVRSALRFGGQSLRSAVFGRFGTLPYLRCRANEGVVVERCRGALSVKALSYGKDSFRKGTMTNEAPTRAVRWPIVRIKAGSATRAVLLSSEWVRLSTHFFKTTRLCLEPGECPACEVLPSRPYWYLPVKHPQGGSFGLIELSNQASCRLEQACRFACRRFGPGIEIEFSRQSSKRPICSEVVGESDCKISVSLFEWASPLMAVFGLPAFRPEECAEQYWARVRASVAIRAQLLRDEVIASKGGVRGRG